MDSPYFTPYSLSGLTENAFLLLTSFLAFLTSGHTLSSCLSFLSHSHSHSFILSLLRSAACRKHPRFIPTEQRESIPRPQLNLTAHSRLSLLSLSHTLIYTRLLFSVHTLSFFSYLHIFCEYPYNTLFSSVLDSIDSSPTTTLSPRRSPGGKPASTPPLRLIRQCYLIRPTYCGTSA